MSITDELREWVHASLVGLFSSGWERDLIAIADRIDKEHAEAVADALQLRGEPDRWVELPVDADGVPIKLGDNVALGDGTFEVRRLELYDRDSWDVLDRFGEPFSPLNLRHVQPDSWERIIEDAANYEHDGWQGSFRDFVDGMVERCRRLAGDGA